MLHDTSQATAGPASQGAEATRLLLITRKSLKPVPEASKESCESSSLGGAGVGGSEHSRELNREHSSRSVDSAGYSFGHSAGHSATRSVAGDGDIDAEDWEAFQSQISVATIVSMEENSLRYGPNHNQSGKLSETKVRTAPVPSDKLDDGSGLAASDLDVASAGGAWSRGLHIMIVDDSNSSRKVNLNQPFECLKPVFKALI